MKNVLLPFVLGLSSVALADGLPPNACQFHSDAGFYYLADAGSPCLTYTGQCGTCEDGGKDIGAFLCAPGGNPSCPPGTPTASRPESCGGAECPTSGGTSGSGSGSGGSSSGGGATSGGCSSAGRGLGPWLLAGLVPLLLLRRKRRRA
ncbi:MAG TPA: hypothetical protein VMB50_13535 [Myxococcales bacterium]|nr:hypothetical protein [Myxococcales bacterium]